MVLTTLVGGIIMENQSVTNGTNGNGSTHPAITRSGSAVVPINYDSTEVLQTIKNTVGRGSSDSEFLLFIQQCKATGLNPFKREVWLIPGKEKQNGDRTPAQIMTGINGFYAIANAHPLFDGIELEYGPEIVVELKAQKAPTKTSVVAPEWVEAKVFRKDRSRPQSARAYWREYSKDLVSYYGHPTIWAQIPSVMLSKCAESMALRKAFPQELNGLYTQEEMPAEYASTSQPAEAPAGRPAAKPATKPAAQAQPENEIQLPPVEGNPWHHRLEGAGDKRPEMAGRYLWEIPDAWFVKAMKPANANRLTPADKAHIQAAMQYADGRSIAKEEAFSGDSDERLSLEEDELPDFGGKQAMKELKAGTYPAVTADPFAPQGDPEFESRTAKPISAEEVENFGDPEFYKD